MDRSKIYPEMGVIEREKALKNISTVHEHLAKYSRELDDNTLAKIREDKCNADIAIERLKEQQKVANDGYKAKIKELQNKAAGWMKEIETGKREEEGLLSGIVDQEEGRVYFYDRYGDMIKSRPILPEEKVTQGRLFENDEAQKAAEEAVFGGDVKIETEEHAALVGEAVTGLEEITEVEFEEGDALEGLPEVASLDEENEVLEETAIEEAEDAKEFTEAEGDLPELGGNVDLEEGGTPFNLEDEDE